MNEPAFDVVTVTLNPAIDRTVSIPGFTAGSVNRVESERSQAGGKGVNVAAALATYGHRVAATGFLGKENAELFEGLCHQTGIADRFVRIAGSTRAGIKIVDAVRHETTDINFPGVAPAPQDVAALRQQLLRLESGIVVLAGSLPPGVEPGVYAELTRELRARDVRVVLDASGEPLRLALEAVPHVIKPNIHELEMLLGRALPKTDSVIEAARQLVARGIELVVVSMGAQGACFVSAQEVILAEPPDVEVLSTVGAGDAMVAGIVSAQFHHLALAECARLATAFSCDALVRGQKRAEAIEALKRQVNLS